MKDLHIEQRPIASLVPYPRNARTHSDSQIAEIARSIEEFGWTNPVLIDGENGVIAGHGRLRAAEQLGLTDVPVIELAHLTPEQRRAYVLADNRLAQNAGWDAELLSIELSELKDFGFDLSLLGFASEELQAALEPVQPGLTDPDETPEPPATPTSQAGDLWLLGKHRVLCGDSTSAESYAQLLGPGGQVDMVFTDPPYNVNYQATARNSIRGETRQIANDNLGADFDAFLHAAVEPMVKACRGAIYIAMSNSELQSLRSAFSKAGGHWSTYICWAKNTFTMGGADYQSQYELLLYGWPEGAKRFWCGARDQGNVWPINKPRHNDLHPTMKPVELVERAIVNSSKLGSLILDSFGGSGSTLIAAERTGREARLIELAPAYVDVIVRRWQEYTGREAILAETDDSYGDVSRRRSERPTQDCSLSETVSPLSCSNERINA